MRMRRTLLVTALLLAPGSQILAQASDTNGFPSSTDSAYFARYHPAPRDTLSPATYEGWKQFELNCSRCHGQDAQGSSFAPSLVAALKPGGAVPTDTAFLRIACNGVPGTGMPAWCTIGLSEDNLKSIYLYVKGRSDGTIHPGRPMRGPISTASAPVQGR
jgi:mono/diheme cytochrome c family protein